MVDYFLFESQFLFSHKELLTICNRGRTINTMSSLILSSVQTLTFVFVLLIALYKSYDTHIHT